MFPASVPSDTACDSDLWLTGPAPGLAGRWWVSYAVRLLSGVEQANLRVAKGQLFMMGFDGTTVTPQIRTLIEKHHLGCILLTAKNLKCTRHVFHAWLTCITAWLSGTCC